jgi:hypothetical protein
MAETEYARTRAPRGTKAVAQAFFDALQEIPDARQAEVARAAQLAIRDGLKNLRGKAKSTAPKAKGGKRSTRMATKVPRKVANKPARRPRVQRAAVAAA